MSPVARGERIPNLPVKNVRIEDVFSGEITKGNWWRQEKVNSRIYSSNEGNVLHYSFTETFS